MSRYENAAHMNYIETIREDHSSVYVVACWRSSRDLCGYQEPIPAIELEFYCFPPYLLIMLSAHFRTD